MHQLKAFYLTVFLVIFTRLTWAADSASATKAWEVVLPHSFAGQPQPKFDRGWFLVRDIDFSLMSIYDTSDKLVRRSHFSIPGATQNSIADIAASPGGGLIVAGGAITSEGQVANFLAWLSPAGVVQRVVRVSPFIPLRICAATDGSVWAAGKQADAERWREVQNHDVLRRFDPDGRLTNSLLPRGLFGVSDHPAHGRSTLSCGPNQIGFFSIRANEWIEVSSGGELLGRWKGPGLGQEAKTSGIGMTADGTVYATAYSVLRPGSANPGASLFRLEKSSGRWLPVSFGAVLGPDLSSHYAEIIGTDGANLVMASALPVFMAVRVE